MMKRLIFSGILCAVFFMGVAKAQDTALSFRIGNVVFRMIPVAGGTYAMGCTSEQQPCEPDELPVHQVSVHDFYMAETEVTQALWVAVMGENPSRFKGDSLPVECISWNDAQNFIAKLNQMTARHFRLPTEAEWEYAARGGQKSGSFCYSGAQELTEVAWCGQNSNSRTHPVKTKKPNELGIYDMTGNVWEWCSDWYKVYGDTAQTDPQGPAEGKYRMHRGGCWSNTGATCRVSYRIYKGAVPERKYDVIGMRLAL